MQTGFDIIIGDKVLDFSIGWFWGEPFSLLKVLLLSNTGESFFQWTIFEITIAHFSVYLAVSDHI